MPETRGEAVEQPLAFFCVRVESAQSPGNVLATSNGIVGDDAGSRALWPAVSNR